MPTYDYVCVNCGHRLEDLHGVNAPGPTTCPDCGGALRRSFSAPAVHFKGSGWAKVDRRSASRSSKKDEDTAPVAASGEDGSKSSEGTSGDGGTGDGHKGEGGTSSGESAPSDASSSDASRSKSFDRPAKRGAGGRTAEAKPKASNAAE